MIELPASPTGAMIYSKKSNLDLRVDTLWGGIHGYRPVTCTITARAPEAADRQIMFRFLASFRGNEHPTVVVEKHFELPANAMTATVRMLVPQYTEWRSVGCETWVDGVKDDELSVLDTMFPVTQSGQNFSAMVIDNTDLVPRRMFRGIRGGPAEFFESPTGQLLEEWMEYSSLDVVVTTRSDLESDKLRHPERFPELLKWIRAGGNLWICTSGRKYEQIPDIEEVLGISQEQNESTPDEAVDEESLLKRGWRFPKVDNPSTDALEKLSQLTSPEIALAEPDPATPEIPVDSRHWFTMRPLGMGTVTVFVGIENMSRQGSRELAWTITQSLLADRISWRDRHGNDPGGGNENFNDFLIPDVGAAPVTAFQILLSLFVLGIGPVNYFLLKRQEQLPLLLVTVPLAAVTTTLLLLLYGFSSEGFGTLVRARSFTLLDQKTQSAACWTRLSYFAGMTPSEGLDFPDDTVIYPILPSMYLTDHREFRRYAAQRRDVTWDGSQELTNGWLASRTPTQYLTIASRDTKKQIGFENSGDTLWATNRLGVNVLSLVVEDADGKFYVGENLRNSESLTLTATTQVKAMLLLRNQLSDNAPEFPPGTMETLSMVGGIELLPFTRNLMETQLAAITSAVSKGWGPNTYFAITDRGIETSLGMDEITENSSFHLVRGTW